MCCIMFVVIALACVVFEHQTYVITQGVLIERMMAELWLASRLSVSICMQSYSAVMKFKCKPTILCSLPSRVRAGCSAKRGAASNEW